MNLRFWGGWFLVLMILGIVLTMGCEKGALGVKTATVIGKVVDRDNPNIPIANATVRMMSKTAVGSSQLSQGANYVSTVTNANGEFIFENVTPDNVVFEVEASGYSKIQYPQVTAEDTTADTGDTTTTTTTTTTDTGSDLTAQVQEVYVMSGSVTNIGILTMKKISNPLPDTIHVSIVLRDKTSLEFLPETAGPVTISFNNQTITLPVSNWRNGVDLTGNPITINAEANFTVTVKANPSYYLTYTTQLSGAADIQAEFLIQPVSYNLILRCTNVPDYIQGGIINVYAETIPVNTASPPKVLATQTISNLGTLTQPNLPAVISLPGLSLPVNLRIQVRGYKDEVMQISQNNLPAGSQGNYRIDINFLYNNGTTNLIYDPTIASQAGLLDNQIKRNVVLEIAGPDLRSNDSVSANISLPYDHVEYYNGVAASNVCVNNHPITATFVDTVVGYNLNWGVTIAPGPTSVSYASGSYTISNENPILINVPDTNPAGGLAIGVNAQRSQ